MTLPRLVACLLLWSLSLSPAAAADAPVVAGPRVGEAVPQNLGWGPDDEPLTVEQFKGKVLVVSFWASWCGPCLKELPILDNIQRKVGPDQLRVIAINIEKRDTYRKLLRRNQGATVPLALTLAHDRGGKTFPVWGEGGIPYLLIIDPDGVLKAKYRGYGEGMVDSIVRELSELLAAQVATLRAAGG